MATTSAKRVSVEDVPGDDFAEFYERSCAMVERAVAPIVGPDALDVTHDAMMIAMARWSHVATLDQPVAWVRKVAVRLAWRRAGRDRKAVTLRPVTPTDDFAERERAVDLEAVLTYLQPEHAAVFVLSQFDDIEVAEISRRTGVPTATVKVWVHRSRRRLADRACGLHGRWVSEQVDNPSSLAARMRAHGHDRYVESALEHLVDRTVRWELRIADGRYWLGTDDGARMDRGLVRVTPTDVRMLSVAEPAGTAVHRWSLDGDRLQLPLARTEIVPTGGAPDEVYRAAYFGGTTLKWQGPLGHLPPD